MAKSTVGTYKLTVWKACATYVKLRDANSNGMVKCCTCDKTMSIYDQDCNAGHFVPGHNNTTYFDDAIIHPQCSHCNCAGSGEQYKYGLFMKEKYGYTDSVIEDILALRHKTKKLSMEDLKTMKTNFDNLSEVLRREKGLQ